MMRKSMLAIFAALPLMTGGCVQTVPGRSGPPRNFGQNTQPPYPADNCVEKTGPDWDYSASPSMAR